MHAYIPHVDSASDAPKAALLSTSAHALQIGAELRIAQAGASDGQAKPPHFPSGWPSVDIRGAWAAGRYRLMQRYRSGMPHNADDEFDAPFALLDRIAPDHFDIQWIRHTGKWWRVHAGATLVQALHLLERDGVLHPP